MFNATKFAVSAISVIALTFSVSSPVHAASSATATISSDYLWRGISFNSYSGASVQADLNHTTDFGLTAGIWAGNIAFPGNYFGGYEFDPYVAYTLDMGDFKPFVSFMWYTFARASYANSHELSLGLKWKDLTVAVSQIPKYFSFETSYVYAYATYTLHLMEKWHLAPTVGYADFEKKDIAGLYNDYYHAKLGLQYKVEKYTLEIAGSHTNRRGNDGTGNNNVKLQDDAVIATYTVVF